MQKFLSPPEEFHNHHVGGKKSSLTVILNPKTTLWRTSVLFCSVLLDTCSLAQKEITWAPHTTDDAYYHCWLPMWWFLPGLMCNVSWWKALLLELKSRRVFWVMRTTCSRTEKSICHLPCDLPIIEAGYIQPVHLCLKETDRDNRHSQTTRD